MTLVGFEIVRAIRRMVVNRFVRDICKCVCSVGSSICNNIIIYIYKKVRITLTLIEWDQ